MSISPNVPSSQESYHYESSGTPRWISVLFALLFIALGAVGFFAAGSAQRDHRRLRVVVADDDGARSERGRGVAVAVTVIVYVPRPNWLKSKSPAGAAPP